MYYMGHVAFNLATLHFSIINLSFENSTVPKDCTVSHIPKDVYLTSVYKIGHIVCICE